MRSGQRLVRLVSAARRTPGARFRIRCLFLGDPPALRWIFAISRPCLQDADLLTILPGPRAGLVEGLANADQTIQAIQLTKTGGGVFLSDYKTSSALHASFGVQREIARDLVLSADFAYRHFVHLALG